MTELNMDQEYLAKKLDVCSATMSRKMNGKRQWLLREMYAVLELLMLPHEALHEYFPKDGVSKIAEITDGRKTA
jgi:DNA-binding XRE family transcriptional regulator